MRTACCKPFLSDKSQNFQSWFLLVRGEQANNERSHSHDGVPVPDVPIPGTMQEEEAPHFSLVAYFAYAGPGLLVAAAYTDPGSVETALAAGTFFGARELRGWEHIMTKCGHHQFIRTWGAVSSRNVHHLFY